MKRRTIMFPLIVVVAACSGLPYSPVQESARSGKAEEDHCGNPRSDAICIVVLDADSRRGIPNARVLTVSSRGLIDTGVVTDELGEASIATQTGDVRYIIVDHDSYFIGGLRWMEGVREYYILLKIATIP